MVHFTKFNRFIEEIQRVFWSKRKEVLTNDFRFDAVISESTIFGYSCTIGYIFQIMGLGSKMKITEKISFVLHLNFLQSNMKD